MRRHTKPLLVEIDLALVAGITPMSYNGQTNFWNLVAFATGLYPLKTENETISDVFREYRKRAVT